MVQDVEVGRAAEAEAAQLFQIAPVVVPDLGEEAQVLVGEAEVAHEVKGGFQAGEQEV